MGQAKTIEPGTMRIETDSQTGDLTLFLAIDAAFAEPAGSVELWLTVAHTESPDVLVAATPCYVISPTDERAHFDLDINMGGPNGGPLSPLESGEYVARISSGARVLAQDVFSID